MADCTFPGHWQATTGFLSHCQMLQSSGLKEQAKQQVLHRLRDSNLPTIGTHGLIEHIVAPAGGEGGSPSDPSAGFPSSVDRGSVSRRVAGGWGVTHHTPASEPPSSVN